MSENIVAKEESFEQLDLFTDYEAKHKEKQEEDAILLREKKMQLAILDIKKKYGKNAILKGTNLEEGAMTKERNKQIGGHKA
jgi:DNA polymerase V